VIAAVITVVIAAVIAVVIRGLKNLSKMGLQPRLNDL